MIKNSLRINLIRFKYHLSKLGWHNCTTCAIPSRKLICNDCYDGLEKLAKGSCIYCKKPCSNGIDVCKTCTKQKPYFDNLYCTLSYSQPTTTILHALKYKVKTKYAFSLGYLLYQNLVELPVVPDLIIPVPLHKTRLQERGFNQVSLLLNYYIAVDNKIPVISKIVSRTKPTPHQTLVNNTVRKNNLIDAFKLHKNIAGLHIIVIDDVVTTGTTVNALAKLLKDNGAKQVDVCCLMRAI